MSYHNVTGLVSNEKNHWANRADTKSIQGLILIRKINARAVYYVLNKYVQLKPTPITKKSSYLVKVSYRSRRARRTA